MIAPFLEALVEPHFEGQRGRAPREIVQDLSSRGLSFFSANHDLVSNADRIHAVTVECPDGLAATIGVSSAHVRATRSDAPVRVALEFEHPRPPIRTMSSLQRLADGLYAPRRHSDAPRLVRAILGADPEAIERRSGERIRVPLEEQITVRLERAGVVVAEAALADASPFGFGCIASEPVNLDAPIDHVKLVSKGRELLRRRVREVFTDWAIVRGQPKMRLRVVIEPQKGPMSLALPLWTGAHEFGSVRLKAGTAELVQSALLMREDVRIVEARTSQELETALDLSYEAFIGEGDVDVTHCPRPTWADEYDKSSTVLIAHAGDLIVGTIRLIDDGPQGLPYEKYTPRECWPAPCARRAEGGRLAVSRAYRQDVNSRLGLAILLIARDVLQAQSRGIERIVIGVRSTHERFYRAIGFKATTPPFVHMHYGLPAQLLEIDVENPGPLRRFMR